MLRKSSYLLGAAGLAGAGALAFNLSALSPVNEVEIVPPRAADGTMVSILENMQRAEKRNHSALMNIVNAAEKKDDIAVDCLALKSAHDEYLRHSNDFESATRQRIEDKTINVKRGEYLLQSTLSMRRTFTGVNDIVAKAFCHPHEHNLI